jgi:tetratricopeptide (TPR) repeat protein
MKRFPSIAVALAAFALAASPANAQYATEFSPAKLIKQGTTSVPIAGSGTVVVQVQVNADGTHKAIKVIKSTNSGDNGAALSIAQASVYRPAHRGTSAVTAFYDFTLKFHGKSVATSTDESSNGGAGGGSLSPAAASVAALIRQKNYAAAKAKAQSELATSPNDQSLQQMLGVAAFDSGDVNAAAQAFDQVSSIGTQFKPAAAASFAAAAVAQVNTNPTTALTYANKAVALQPDANSKFALGAAQLANGQNAAALATLQAVHAQMNASKLSTAAKVNIDSQLMAAYSANNDPADVSKMAAEIKQIDPTSTLPNRVLGNNYLKAGIAAADAKNYDEAYKDFDLAGSQGDQLVSVTAYTEAAFLVAKTDKPDYKKMQAYADKAIAAKSDDPQANFALGIALTGEWAQGHDNTMKQKAQDALTKADSLAKAAGNQQLALAIESFMKKNLTQSGAPPSQ